MSATGLTASDLAPGSSAVLSMPTTAWTSYSMSWTCSDTSDTGAHATLQGSADGSTFFPLRTYDGFPAAETGTGVQFFKFQPAVALRVTVACSEGNTVTVTVAGN